MRTAVKSAFHRRSTLMALCCAVLYGSAFAAMAQSAAEPQAAALAEAAQPAVQAQPVEQASAPSDVAKADAADSADKKVPFSRRCMQYTGSHIRSYDTRSGKRPCIATGPGSAYSKDEIDKTGQVDLGKAMRQLDPAIKSN